MKNTNKKTAIFMKQITQDFLLGKISTLYNVISRTARNLLENREDIKYVFDPFILPYKFGLIFIIMKQKKIFF